MPHRTLTLKEAALYLHLPCGDVEDLIRHHEIEAQAQGARIVFRRRDVEAWALRHVLALPSKRLSLYHRRTSDSTRPISPQARILGALARIEAIEPALPSKTKPSVLRDMVAVADRTDLLCQPRELLASLEERESLCSTALADGIALLHPRSHDPYMALESFIGLGRALRPIPFGAADGRQTDLFFLICCLDDRLHLHVLARLCLLCKQPGFLAGLRAAVSAGEMLAALRHAEDQALRQL